MKIPGKALLKFAYLSAIAGLFAALSYFSFSALVYFSAPELEIFSNFLRAESPLGWIISKAGSWKSASLTFLFLLCCSVLAAIGFMTALFSKFLAKHAEKALDAG